MELENPFSIKRVSSVLNPVCSFDPNDNQIAAQVANTSPELRSPHTPNLFLTNSIKSKFYQELVYEPQAKIKILNESWIVISGKVKLISKQNKQFQACSGFIWFISTQIKQQIKEVEAVGTVVLKKISHNMAITENIQNYYKDVRDILINCPYFSSWNLKSIMDIACCSSTFKLQSNQMVYESGSNPNYLYLLKSGQVQLTRTCPIKNRLLQSYEMQLERCAQNQGSSKFIIVSGDCFGLDGIFLKQGIGRVYTAVTKTQCQISRISGELINVIYQLFDPKSQDKFLNKAKQYMTDTNSNSIPKLDNGIGIINRKNEKKREFVKMINEYQNRIKMKSVAHKIPRIQKSHKMQKPRNPFVTLQQHGQIFKKIANPDDFNFHSIIPQLKSTKVYVGLLKQKILHKQYIKQHQNYKKKVEQQILKASKSRRETKSTDCFRIKAYSLQKRNRYSNLNPQ